MSQSRSRRFSFAISAAPFLKHPYNCLAHAAQLTTCRSSAIRTPSRTCRSRATSTFVAVTRLPMFIRKILPFFDLRFICVTCGGRIWLFALLRISVVKAFPICTYQRSSAAESFCFFNRGKFGNSGNLVPDPRSSAFIRGKECFSRVQFGCLAFQLLKSLPCIETSCNSERERDIVSGNEVCRPCKITLSTLHLLSSP